MEALYQQNNVLERDIHTCNYERINLTQQLHESKEKLEKLNFDIKNQRFDKEHRARKSLFPVLSKDKDTNSIPGSGPIKPMIQLRNIPSNRSGNSQNSIVRPASRAHVDTSQESQDLKAAYDIPNRRSISNSMNPQKKSKKFAYVNGKLEARFNVKRGGQ